MKQINWLGWATASILVLLVGGLAWAWFTPQLDIKNSTWQPPAPVKADIQALLPKQPQASSPESRKDDQLLLQMQERPLFALSRRPPPPPPPPPPPKKEEPPPEPDHWAMAKISGVFDGPVVGAIVQYEGKEQRLMLGQSLGGWKLLSVQGREIELERNGVQRRIALTKAAMDKEPAVSPSSRPRTTAPVYQGQSSPQAAAVFDPRDASRTLRPAPSPAGSPGDGAVR